MEMDQFMEIIENSDEFIIDETPADADIIYKVKNELTAITANDILINPSKIGIKGNSIDFWVNPSYLGWDLESDILIGTIVDIKDLKTLIID